MPNIHKFLLSSFSFIYIIVNRIFLGLGLLVGVKKTILRTLATGSL